MPRNKGDVGCALNRVRKTSNDVRVRRRKSGDGQVRNATSREKRLSAVIGRYIRPPKSLTGNANDSNIAGSKKKSWQMDSSSWEFLGNESDADVSSSSTSRLSDDEEEEVSSKSNVTTLNRGSEAKPLKRCSSSKDSLYESGNNDTMNTTEKDSDGKEEKSKDFIGY